MSEFERLLDSARDIAVRYVNEIGEREVMPSESTLAGLATLREPMPASAMDAFAVIRQLGELGARTTVATTGGRFFGFVVGGALPVTVAANWLASAWDQNAGNWILSPIAAELEDVSAGWLLELFDLPRTATVGFVTGSTMGAFSAFAAARSALLRRLGWDVKGRGLNGAPRLRMVVSDELHPTNLAALGYAGFGLDDVERCPTDAQGRIIPSEMPALDEHCIVVVQAGNINSGAFDPFKEICEKARAGGRVGARGWRVWPVGAHVSRAARADRGPGDGGLLERGRAQVAQPAAGLRDLCVPRCGGGERCVWSAGHLPGARCQAAAQHADSGAEPQGARCGVVGRAEDAGPQWCGGVDRSLLPSRAPLCGRLEGCGLRSDEQRGAEPGCVCMCR